MSQILLNVENIRVEFTHAVGWLRRTQTTTVLDDISLELRAGQTLGVVGESGCGKTTLARVIMGLIYPSRGSIHTEASLDRQSDIQFIFQDPMEALNPRMTVEKLILEPLDYRSQRISKAQQQEKLSMVLQQVGLDEDLKQRYPHELSGGQCQRIGIARAMINDPKILICDEPVSALDVSIRAQIIELLKQLQLSMNLSLIFIAHDLSLVRYISDQIVVMYKGNIMESGPVETIFRHPAHPYTHDLLQSEPRPDPLMEKARLARMSLSIAGTSEAGTQGCLYQSRCTEAGEACRQRPRELTLLENGQKVRCFYPLDTP